MSCASGRGSGCVRGSAAGGAGAAAVAAAVAAARKWRGPPAASVPGFEEGAELTRLRSRWGCDIPGPPRAALPRARPDASGHRPPIPIPIPFCPCSRPSVPFLSLSHPRPFPIPTPVPVPLLSPFRSPTTAPSPGKPKKGGSSKEEEEDPWAEEKGRDSKGGCPHPCAPTQPVPPSRCPFFQENPKSRVGRSGIQTRMSGHHQRRRHVSLPIPVVRAAALQCHSVPIPCAHRMPSHRDGVPSCGR